MDVLSDAVTAMRTGRPHSGRVRGAASFGMRLPAVAGAGFHIVLQGSCWLFPPEGAPIALGVGDVAFLPRGAAHGLADSLSTPLVDVSASPAEIPPSQEDTEPAGKRVTNGLAAGAVLLCGAYLLDRTRAHTPLAGLPETIHTPA